MQVTSFEEMQAIAQGEVVEFAGFVTGKPFKCRVRRISIEDFIMGDNVPNRLMDRVGEIFDTAIAIDEGEIKKPTKKQLKDVEDLEDSILKVIMIEPKFEEVEKAGLKLSSAQRAQILDYGFGEVDKYSDFRSEQENTEID